MEHECLFTSMTISYGQKGLVLSGPKKGSFRITHDGVSYTASIEQGIKRNIAICADEPVCWARLTDPLCILEQLLMVFDGTFIQIEDVKFSGSPDGGDGSMESGQFLAQRLSYFKTSEHFTIGDKLVDWDCVLADDVVAKWQELLNELDIANQTYLYDISDSGMPVDLRLAFLVELAEPLIEIVNEEKHLLPSLKPGERGTSLKRCLGALIDIYGHIIFKREIRDGLDDCLEKLVYSRVRIMHIKRNQIEGKYYDGKHSVYYMRKLSLLYRTTLFNLLGLSPEVYEQKLRKRTDALDSWFEELQGLS